MTTEVASTLLDALQQCNIETISILFRYLIDIKSISAYINNVVSKLYRARVDISSIFNRHSVNMRLDPSRKVLFVTLGA